MSTFQLIALPVILVITALLPLLVHKVEKNLEIFLFVMGVAAIMVTKQFNWHEHLEVLGHIFSNFNLYLITAVVFALSLAFMLLEKKIDYVAGSLLEKLPLKVAVVVVILVLGLLSSLITAIIASMLLAEIVGMLPIKRKQTVRVNVVACFAIGLGAALTPVGEPLSTIVISKLDADFLYLFRLIGPYVIPGVILLAMLGAFVVHDWKKDVGVSVESLDPDKLTMKGVLMRTVKIFAFIVALELLGAGFQPFIDAYVLKLDNFVLYLINMVSAILDNATLAAAEISPSMHGPEHVEQVKTILMSLLISGGMLITGNIPNIVTAGRLKISSLEWAKFAVPLGLALMAIYYVVGFVFKI